MSRVAGWMVVLLVASWVVAPSAQSEDLAGWDKDQVAKIAGKIHEGSLALQENLRRKPRPTVGTPGVRSFHNLREEMQVLISASRRLQSAVTDGATREETQPTYERLLTTARRAHRLTARLQLGEDTDAIIDTVSAAIREIRPFYEEEPPI